MNELIKQKEKWEVLFAKVSSMQYGEVISHSEIADIVQEKYRSQAYQTVIDKAKWKLLEVGKTIRSVRGQGYRVLEPDNYTDYSLKYMQQSLVSVKKSDKIQRYAPVDKMSFEQQSIHRQVSDRMSVLKAHMSGTSIEVKMLAKQIAVGLN